jgi:hypothetical protein
MPVSTRYWTGKLYAARERAETAEARVRELEDQCADLRAALEEWAEVNRADLRALKAALAYIGDEANWLGDPLSSTATILGHFTAYEIARRALDGEAE